MNHGWILVCFLFPFLALAQTSGNFKRKATDLILFPNKNQVITSLSYTNTFSEDTIDFGSRKLSSSEIDQNEVSISGMYAFTNKLAVDLKLTQLLAYKDKTTYGSASTMNGETTTTKRSGFRDPEIGVTYRLQDMSTDSFDMNIALNASPKVQDAEDPSTTDDGNAAKGRTDFSANFLFGKRNYSYAWAIGVEVEHQGESETKDATDGDLTTTEAYTTYELLGEIKINAGDVFSLDLGSKWGNTGDYRVSSSSNTFTDYEDVIMFSFFGRGNFHIAESVYFVAGLEVAGITQRKLTNQDGAIFNKKDNTVGEFTLGFTAQL